MGWFEKQIKQRRDLDQQLFEESFFRAAGVVLGQRTAEKISEDHIRPIYKDSDLYTIKAVAQVATGADDSVKAAAFIKSAIKARKDYKGSGTPALYTTEDMLTSCLLLEDMVL